MIFYDDEKKQAKLEKAIEFGFINKYKDPDGIIRYELTPQGMLQWAFEKQFAS